METLHCQTWPGSFDTFAQMQHFHFTCSSWFRLTESLLTSLWGVNLWNVLWSHKDEREVGLLWFTAGARAARNLHLSSAQYIKNMGRFAAHSVLLGVFCLSAALEGWIGKEWALKQQMDSGTDWNFSCLLGLLPLEEPGDHGPAAEVSQEINIVEETVQIFNKIITQLIHFYCIWIF